MLYDNQSDYLTKDEIAEANIYRENSERKLSLSDRVVNGDLLRFYTIENFMPNRSKYDYNDSQDKNIPL